MPEKTKKQLERDKLSRDAAKELKKLYKEKSNSPLDDYFGALFGDNMQKKGAAGGPIPKNKPKKAPPKNKPKKAPPGTKVGPGRKDIPANPHGVDDDTIYLEKGGPVDTPKKKRGNYGPNIGKPFKAMGPVGGLPVNKSGTKIMAGRLAARGYGKAKK